MSSHQDLARKKTSSGGGEESVPVVKVWSVVGVEYAIMTLMLIFVAVSVNWVLVSLINGQTGFSELSSPLALMIVSLPIFAFLFIRLKKAELADPKLKFETSKRRFSQRAQILSFLIVFAALLTVVSTLISSLGNDVEDMGKTISSAFVFMIVWGAIFAYYWFDERGRTRK